MPFILPTSQAKEGRQRVVRESAFSQRERFARPIEEQEEVVRKDKKGNNKIIIFVGLTILGLCLPALAVGGIAFFTKKTPKKHSKKSLEELLKGINTLTPNQIEKIIKDPDTQLQDKETALHIAASENNIEAIEALIDKNANINALDSFKQTPLYKAAEAGNLEAVKILVTVAKADVNKTNSLGDSPLLAAAMKGNEEVVLALMKSSDLDVNMSLNKEEDTALHKAAEAGNLEAVRILVTVAKADVNKENKNGEKPIDKAKNGGKFSGYLTPNPQAPLSS